jgi:hypothetical protein
MVLQGRRVLGEDGTVIGRLHHVIADCPDPAALAAFYPELLGLPVTWAEEDFAVVARRLPRGSDSSSRLACGHLSGLTLAGHSSCTSMSWSMTSKPPSRASWHWAPGASRAETAGHGLRRSGRASVLPHTAPGLGCAHRRTTGL